jgi:hypothetical protein
MKETLQDPCVYTMSTPIVFTLHDPVEEWHTVAGTKESIKMNVHMHVPSGNRNDRRSWDLSNQSTHGAQLGVSPVINKHHIHQELLRTCKTVDTVALSGVTGTSV